MNQKLEIKLKNLPKKPGVYFHKSASGEIIYVGKAAVLRNRVRQYFQQSRARDPKTELLVSEIDDVTWLEVDSEIQALFLESEMIKRYMPRYNILLRDDKHYQYVRIDFKSDHPIIEIVRRPADDEADYFGPYVGSITMALKYLRRIFPFDYKQPKKSGARSSRLYSDIGLSPGVEAGMTSLSDYRQNLRYLSEYLLGNRNRLEAGLRRSMKLAANQKNYEHAARLRDQLQGLENLHKQIIFGDKELFDSQNDSALSELQAIAGINKLPLRIEGYDISHQSGTNNVASMVVFTNGVSDKGQYRKFKMRILGNDDFAHMHEVISRRFSKKNRDKWRDPELLLIDGGKGQLHAALNALRELEVSIPAIGLAKRYETIILAHGNQATSQLEFDEIQLDKNRSHALKLLIRIRDESHRFAVSYHTSLKRKNQTASRLDEIPGVGPATRKKLIKSFGSLGGILKASDEEISQVVGIKRAKTISQYLR
jgi:excinuclease ABC subunit C